ncbi:MAG TPA: hypothetical protein VNN74_11240, partial [Candidatus Micrarchaeia archaeon]|nr:hypothetical protein [Candidatus Micrarchaeia archaeon]
PMLAVKSLELESLGYTDAQVAAGLRWALRAARGTVEAAPAAMREPSLVAQLQHNLISVEPYLDGCAQAARDREHRRGVERARTTGEYRRQVKRGFGTDPQQAGSAWDQAASEAVTAWERTFAGGPT